MSSVRSLGWSISLGVLGVGLMVAAAGAARNAETRRRTSASARQLRDRSVASAAHLRDQAAESAGHLKDQWTQAAGEVRTRAIDTAEDWREKSAGNMERAFAQAAEARDDALAALPDDDAQDADRAEEPDRRG